MSMFDGLVPRPTPEQNPIDTPRDITGMKFRLHLVTLDDAQRDGPREWSDRFAPTGWEGVPLVRNEEAEAILAPLLDGVDLAGIDKAPLAELNQTINDADPEALVYEGTRDEYEEEAVLIAALYEAGQLTRESLWAVFASQFGRSSFGERRSTAWPYLLSWIELAWDEDESGAER